MKLLFLPYYRDTNPYQRDLAESLSGHGVEVGGPTGGGPLGIVGALRRNGVPDVVHFHWLHGYVHSRRRLFSVLMSAFFLLQVVLLRLAGVRVVWTVHNLLSHANATRLDAEAPTGRVDYTESGIDLAVRRLFAPLCDAIIVHCESARDVVERSYRLSPAVSARCHVVHHGHYLDAYPNEVSRTDARERLGLDADARVFLYFGRIQEYKNVPRLVDAFSALDEANARLLVVGNPESDALETELRETSARDPRIRTAFGFVPGDDIQLYMNAADVVVLPFESILTSGSVMLAASFGKPVVAPALGCVGEFLAGDVVYDPADPDGLEAALEKALHADLDAVGRANLAAASACDWESMARLTAAAYRGDAPGTDPLTTAVQREFRRRS